MKNLDLALTLLAAGFLIVFIVLVVLIVIITLYGKIIQFVQNSASNVKSKNTKQTIEETVSSKSDTIVPAVSEKEEGDAIPSEIIAVIAAAVDSIYSKKTHRIRSVKRSRSSRSAWGNAGVVENTKPF